MNRFQNENHDGRWRPPQLLAAALSAVLMVLLMR
jgi:organic hydroperoxide reductase OsmC/OhrA